MTCKDKKRINRSLRFRRHAFLLEFLDGVGSFSEMAGAHTFKNMGCLGELDVVIGYDFDSIAPGVAEIEPLVDAF